MRDRTQAWLAHELGVNEVTVSRWIIGTRRPSRASLQRIAGVLQCEIDEITGDASILTDEERRLLAEFRAMSNDKRAVIWTVVNALKDHDRDSDDNQTG